MNGGGSGGPSSSASTVPPGFRFHPTDEELLYYYLKKKVSYEKIDMDVIRDVDLNKLEPWELNERCKIGSAPQNEWYFFSHKDKKYPTGSRTNRATAAGFWKATGRDKAIRNNFKRIGMRKTLVFYKGRAPHGLKTNWIMHEYRLDDSENTVSGQEDGWVVCRVFKKKNHFKGPEDEAEPVSNFEDNSPGDVLSEPNSDMHYSSLQHAHSQSNYHHQSMGLSLKQQPHEESLHGLQHHYNTSNNEDSMPTLDQGFLQMQMHHHQHQHHNHQNLMMNMGMNINMPADSPSSASCGMKRFFPERSMDEESAKRLHYQLFNNGDSFSSTTTTATTTQGLQMNEQGVQLNMNMNADWSALDKILVASHMMNHHHENGHHDQGVPVNVTASPTAVPPPQPPIPSTEQQLKLPLRSEIDLWAFGK